MSTTAASIKWGSLFTIATSVANRDNLFDSLLKPETQQQNTNTKNKNIKNVSITKKVNTNTTDNGDTPVKKRGRKSKKLENAKKRIGLYKLNKDNTEITQQENNSCMDCGCELAADIMGGQTECTGCGLVATGIISREQEWASNSTDDGGENQIRCGGVIDPLMPVTSMGTYIGAAVKRPVGVNTGTIQRLQLWGSVPPAERSRKNDFNYISNMTENTGISNKVKDDAKVFYTLLYNDEFNGLAGGNIDESATFSKGKCRKGLLAACFFKACQKNGMVRTHDDIAGMFDIETSTLRSGERRFNSIMQKKNINIQFDPHTIAGFVKQYVNFFPNNLTNVMIDYMIILAKRLDDIGLISNNNVKSIACGFIHIMSVVYNLEIDVNEIHKRCSISLMTIKDVSKKLRADLKYVLPHTEYVIYNIRKAARGKTRSERIIYNTIADYIPSLF